MLDLRRHAVDPGRPLHLDGGGGNLDGEISLAYVGPQRCVRPGNVGRLCVRQGLGSDWLVVDSGDTGPIPRRAVNVRLGNDFGAGKRGVAGTDPGLPATILLIQRDS